MDIGAIKLSHFSVKEYLLSSHVEEYFSIDEKSSHSKISELSIAYLLQFDDDSTVLYSMPLEQYAAKYWIDHAKSGGMDPTVLQLILQLFTSESAPFKNWIKISKLEYHSPLYYASLFGMQDVVECLLQRRENAKGELVTPLVAASRKQYEGVVRLLLENGAMVNVLTGEYENALHAASAAHQGSEVIVKLLLENGAEVNAMGGQYGNALQAALFQGNEAIVKLLLENGAELNAMGGEYGNALQAASSQGNDSEATVKLLLENGAEVNAMGGKYGNALQAASSHSVRP